MNSALYAGWVTHKRFAPRTHSLRYAVFQLLLDLDEIETLDRRLRLFSANRANLFSHFDADHGEGGSLRAWAERKLAEAGIAGGGKILLLAMPRVLDAVFNPLSIYYCHDAGGALAGVIYEVNNTFGERHAYVIAADPAGGAGPVRQSCAKAFRVSPFMAMGLTYDFALTRPGAAIRTGVDARGPGGELVLATAFAGERRELSDRTLMWALARFPLLRLQVLAAIHWEALKLWLKGVRPTRLARPSPGSAPFPNPSSPSPRTVRSPA